MTCCVWWVWWWWCKHWKRLLLLLLLWYRYSRMYKQWRLFCIYIYNRSTHLSRWLLYSIELLKKFVLRMSPPFFFFCLSISFFSLSPFEWDSILFPSVRVLISSSPTPSLFAFSFRRSRRHHHTYICIHIYILQIGIVCVSTRHERKRNFENQLLIHIEIECWSQPSQIKHHVKLSVNASSFFRHIVKCIESYKILIVEYKKKMSTSLINHSIENRTELF
jgi:hypothetical protein